MIRFFFAPQTNPICSPARPSLCFLWAQEMTSHAACGGGEVRERREGWGVCSLERFLLLGLSWSLPPGGYDGEDLTRILKDIEGSSLVQMDRWSVQVVTDVGQAEGDPVPYEIINNYFSIGVVSSSETPRVRKSLLVSPETT